MAKTTHGPPECLRADGQAVLAANEYVLEQQIGFVLRQVNQRHTVIFAKHMPEGLTTTQFSVMVRLYEHGPLSRARVGRLTAMDAATIKGVTDRLQARVYVRTSLDASDARLRVLSLTDMGRRLTQTAMSSGLEISGATLSPLSAPERRALLGLLRRLV